MSTYEPGFQSFFPGFSASFCIGQIGYQQHKVKDNWLRTETTPSEKHVGEPSLKDYDDILRI